MRPLDCVWAKSLPLAYNCYRSGHIEYSQVSQIYHSYFTTYKCVYICSEFVSSFHNPVLVLINSCDRDLTTNEDVQWYITVCGS